jgi:hypothetical protein
MNDDFDRSHGLPAAVPEAGRGWSEQNWRTLIITVGGGLAANLATVILVGGAIALVHMGKASSGYRLIVALVFVTIGVVLIVIGNVSRRARDVGLRLGVSPACGPGPGERRRRRCTTGAICRRIRGHGVSSNLEADPLGGAACIAVTIAICGPDLK